MAPMEAGMGMGCWILLVFIIVDPVEDKVSFWDHQPPVGITYRVQTERVFVHLEYLAPRKRGHARQVDSSDTWTVSDVSWCI